MKNLIELAQDKIPDEFVKKQKQAIKESKIIVNLKLIKI